MVPITAALGLVFVYCVAIAIYRLYLSPLAKIPGPKIAGEFCTRSPIISRRS
jgi:hypothetical protein